MLAIILLALYQSIVVIISISATKIYPNRNIVTFTVMLILILLQSMHNSPILSSSGVPFSLCLLGFIDRKLLSMMPRSMPCLRSTCCVCIFIEGDADIIRSVMTHICVHMTCFIKSAISSAWD